MLNTKISTIFRLITLVFLTTIAIELGLQIRRVLPTKLSSSSKNDSDILIIGDSVSSQYPNYLKQSLPNFNFETLITPNASLSEMKVRVNELRRNYFVSIMLLGRFENDNIHSKQNNLNQNTFLILPEYIDKLFANLSSGLISEIKSINHEDLTHKKIDDFISTHQYHKAIPLLKSILKNSGDLDAFATMAFCLIKTSDFSQASNWIRKGLSLNPDHITLNIRKLEVLIKQNKNYHNALENLLVKEPKSHDFYYLLIKELQKNTDSILRPRIIESLEKFNQFTKNDLNNIQSLEFHLNYLLYKKDFKEIKNIIKRLNFIQLQNARVIELVTKYYTMLNNFELAQIELNRLKKNDLPKHLLEALLGDILFSQTKYIEAENHYKSSIKIKPNLSTMKNYAMTLKINSKFIEGLRVFENLISKQPENLDFHLRYGECVFESKMFVQGIKFYEENFQDNNVYKHLALTNFYIGLKKKDKALYHLEISIKLNTNQEVLSKTITRYQEAFNAIIEPSSIPKHHYNIEKALYKELISDVKKKSEYLIILGYPDIDTNLKQEMDLVSDKNIIFLNTNKFLNSNHDKGLLSWDNLHLSQKGNQVLADRLKNIINNIRN